MGTDFVEQAAAIIGRLADLDKRRVVFGAPRHKYRFNQPLGLAEVEEFERTYNVLLPLSYRRFITELGNGGAGPYYGIVPLNFDAPQLLKPFPSPEPFQVDSEDRESWKSEIPGSILISEYGCGIYLLLVVHGDIAGQVWVDARYETGVSPVTDEHTTPMTFDMWWLSVMEEHLDRFERTHDLMEAATDHERIHEMLEPGVLQLHVDETMLSLMDCDPNARPRVYADKPWGGACGLVEEHYGAWLRGNHRRTGST